MVKSSSKSQCCSSNKELLVGLKKGPWKPEEDQKLLAYIEQHGHGSWRTLPAKAGLQRCGKSCRLRWTNYLRPDIRRGKFSLQEEQTIIQLHALLGNRWSAIASQLSKRTDNEIKNYWNTHLKKKLTKMGIDPMTHKPKTNALLLLGRTQHDIANLNHIAQWESARVEAEARLVKESKLSMLLSSSSSSPPKYRHHHVSNSKQSVMDATGAMLPCLDILKAWQSVAWTNNNHNVGTLESPTSVLHNTITTPVVASDNSYSLHNSVFLKADMKTTMSNWECSEKVNIINDHEMDEDDDVMQILHGISNGSFSLDDAPPPPATASCLPSFPEEVVVTTGAGDHLLLDDDVAGIFTGLYSVDESCTGGNLEDNNKYWN